MLQLKRSFRLAFALLFLAFWQTATAQDKAPRPDRSLAGQYKELIEKSNDYQGYKVINQNRLSAFKNSYMDTLNRERKKLAEARAKINEQSSTISSLKGDITSKDKNLAKSNALIDEVQLLGLSVSKSAYSTVMWGMVLILGAALAFVILRSTTYRKEAKYRIKLFEELSSEFQTYKTKATDKERKLARELQTERNKLDEMAGRYR